MTEYEIRGWEAAKDVRPGDEVDFDGGQDGESDWVKILKVDHRQTDDGMLCCWVLANGRVKHVKESEQVLVREEVSPWERTKNDGHRHAWEQVGESEVLAGAVREQCSRCGSLRTAVVGAA